MTKWQELSSGTGPEECMDCEYYGRDAEDACDNMHSDHYGHVLTDYHMACEEFAPA